MVSAECRAMAWYEMRATSPPPTEAGLFRMEQGQEIGSRARHLFPDGVFVVPENGESAQETTARLINDASVSTLFEAAVLAAPFSARADIALRVSDGWHIIEVKSRFANPEKIDGESVDDLAYTVMVFRRGGVKVTKASLALLSRSYCYGDPPDQLFEIIDATTSVEERVLDFAARADDVANDLLQEGPPEPSLNSACRDCGAFATDCIGTGIERSVLEIPGLHHTKLKKLAALAIIDLAKVPDDLNLNERQERAKNAALSNTLFIESSLEAALLKFEWPCHYLDFETVATVLPLYPGHHCHQQVLTQFSIHHRDGMAEEVTHSDFLADALKDCQKEVAVALIAALDNKGSIVVYSPFEKTRIKALQTTFPELAVPLQSLLDRLVDLHTVVSDHVYHPAFRGSFSIKKVLPALVPDLTYEGMAVGDGDTAITRFARMARGEMSGDLIKMTRQQLLDYCKLDTLAMVRLHEHLSKLAPMVAGAA
jgi:predicted RecB family nuclease